MKRVFISSTSRDLLKHREAVRDTVLTLEMHPVMMEHFPAMDADAIAACKAKVLASDIFVGIYAHRYGYIPTGHMQSITEMEYDWAIEANLPIYIFVVDENYGWNENFYDEHQDELKALKKRLGKAKVWKTFTNPDSLARAVNESLTYDKDALSKREKRQRNQLVLGFSSVLFLIVLVLIFVFLNQPDEEKIGTSQADREATNIAIADINKTAVATAWTPTPTATATFTPTFTPLPSATPLEGTQANIESGEILVIVAQFEQSSGAVQEPEIDILDVLNSAAQDFGNVRILPIQHSIADRSEAQTVSDIYGATMVVYGRISLGGIRASYEITARTGEIGERVDEVVSVSLADVENFDVFLFNALDTEYVLNFTLGQLAYFDGNYERAKSSFTVAITKLDPDRADELNGQFVYLFRGNSFYNLEDFANSIEDFDKALVINPVFTPAYINLGNAYSELENYEQAIVHYEQALALDPNYTLAYNGRGLAYADLGDYDQALADYDQALALDPEYTHVYNNRGLVYADLGNYVQAIANYEQALALDPQLAAVYSNRGLAYADLGDYEQALADYDQALTLNPEYTYAYNNRGRAHAHAGNYEQALADYNQALDYNPELVEAYTNRGLIYDDLGGYEQAIEDHTQAILLDPMYAIAYNNRGRAYGHAGNYEQAIADYDQAIVLDPELAEAYDGRGVTYADMENYEQALDDYNQALALNPTSANTYFNQGTIYFTLMDLDLAKQDFAYAIEYDANFVSGYCGLGLTTYLLGELEATVENLQICIDNFTGDKTLFADYLARAEAQLNVPTLAPPEIVDNPILPNDSILIIPGVRPLMTVSEPNTPNNSVICLASEEAVVLQTVKVTDTNWVELNCDAGTGWVKESSLVN